MLQKSLALLVFFATLAGWRYDTLFLVLEDVLKLRAFLRGGLRRPGHARRRAGQRELAGSHRGMSRQAVLKVGGGGGSACPAVASP